MWSRGRARTRGDESNVFGKLSVNDTAQESWPAARSDVTLCCRGAIAVLLIPQIDFIGALNYRKG